MTKPINDLTDLFFDQLRDIHSVERQVAGTLPHLANLATLPELRAFLTEQHRLALERRKLVTVMFERHLQELGSDESKGMKGLIEGGDRHLECARSGTMRDLLLVAHYSRITHYEVAAYRFVSKLALWSGYKREAEILFASLEKKQTASRDLDALDEVLYADISGKNVL